MLAPHEEGIYVKTREELVADYHELKEGGEYNVDEGEGDVIIQQAVSDLYTIGGDGPIAERRFDIRYCGDYRRESLPSFEHGV